MDKKPRCLMDAYEIFEDNRARKKQKQAIVNDSLKNIGVDKACRENPFDYYHYFQDAMKNAMLGGTSHIYVSSPIRAGKSYVEAMYLINSNRTPMFNFSVCEPSRPLRKSVVSTIVKPKQLTRRVEEQSQ